MKDLRVLSVEKSEFDAELVKKSLSRNFNLIDFHRVDSAESLKQILDRKNWDVILADYDLEGFSGIEALSYVREHNESLPFIIVSASIGEEKAVEILKFGADDIVLKNNLARLAFSIDRVLRARHFRESEARAKRLAERAIRAREQMLAVVSHDLRNPLGAIQLNAETIKDKLEHIQTVDDAKATVSHVQSIIRSSLRMKSLIADVLDRVRLEGGGFSIHRTRRCMNDFLNEVVEIFSPLAQEKSVQLRLLDPQLKVEADLDFERLHQILSNLVGNAVKFTPFGGQVTLSVSIHAEDLEFRVADTGPGIDQQDLDKIFEKYWQTASAPRQGLGLGLAIAKDLVKAHGGKIWVESDRARGTTFGFHIPCQWKEAGRKVNKEVKANSRWICLVDDDDDLRGIMEENLRKLGYRVSAYENGKSALMALSERSFQPDLMILDYRLPDMNGGDIMEKMRPSWGEKKMPVIFLSAEANLSRLADQHRATAFLTKPLRLRDLAKAVDRLL